MDGVIESQLVRSGSPTLRPLPISTFGLAAAATRDVRGAKSLAWLPFLEAPCWPKSKAKVHILSTE